MLIQETKIKGNVSIPITSSDNTKLTLYNSGNEKSLKGVAILVKENTNVKFEPISERLCYMKLKLDNNTKIHLISVYAPTLEETVKRPKETEKLYDQISSVINKINKRDTLIVGGDFNARVKPTNDEERNNSKGIVGRYAHNNSKLNENGKLLIEICKIHNLKLINTFFKHKSSRITTWESPKKIVPPRKNPYRFQIDYIAIRKNNNMKVTNAKAVNGIRVTSDHKPVIVHTKIYINNSKPKPQTTSLNVVALQEEENKLEFQRKVEQKLGNQNDNNEEIQEKWNNIVKATVEAAEETIGRKKKNIVSKNNTIINLSHQQKKLRNEMDSTTSPEQKEKLKVERNKIINKIHTEINKEQTDKIDKILNEIENKPDDSRRMFEAVKSLKRCKPKNKMLIKDNKNRLVSNEQEQSTIIANHFEKLFYKNAEQYPTIIPREMTIPFTTDEIKTAVRKMKNNKSPGIDNVNVELIKFSPDIVYQQMADIYNEISRTGNHPKELTHGILCPLPKPGKKIGPVENLRPIILLSTLRKILALIMMNRIGDRIDKIIPPSQAAYRSGRSTTEHVFAVKLAVERTITAKKEEIHLLFLDMSKAFDSINRKLLLEDLNNIINKDELQIMQLLLNVKIQVRCGTEMSDSFNTDTGAPQGDGSSATEFTVYLANTLKAFYERRIKTLDHDYITNSSPTIANHQGDHNYCNPNTRVEHFDMNLQYADDLGEVSTNPAEIQYKKDKLPICLEKRDLILNKSKTEEFRVSKNHDGWKKCKFLGSYIDTETDINNRKRLLLNAADQLKYIFQNKHLPMRVKIKAFNVYLESIFLYNSELWTTTHTLNNKIDAFHRRMLRTLVLNIRYPKIMKNTEVYEKTKQQPWSVTIKTRRMRWMGHACRLDKNTPTGKSLRYATNHYIKNQGRPKETWMNIINKQLKEKDIDLKNVYDQAKDKKKLEKLM